MDLLNRKRLRYPSSSYCALGTFLGTPSLLTHLIFMGWGSLISVHFRDEETKADGINLYHVGIKNEYSSSALEMAKLGSSLGSVKGWLWDLGQVTSSFWAWFLICKTGMMPLLEEWAMNQVAHAGHTPFAQLVLALLFFTVDVWICCCAYSVAVVRGKIQHRVLVGFCFVLFLWCWGLSPRPQMCWVNALPLSNTPTLTYNFGHTLGGDRLKNHDVTNRRSKIIFKKA